MNRHRVLRVCGLAVVVLLGLGACGDDDDSDAEGDSGAEDGGAAGDDTETESVSVFDLEEGQCLADASQVQGEAVEELQVVSCDSAHTGEVFSVFDLEGGGEAEFPGPAQIEEQSTSECESAFEDYVGSAVGDSRFEITFLAPTQETWSQGDREVVCIGFVEGEELEESIEGSGE